METKIQEKDIKEGDRLRVVGTYSSYGANEDRTTYFVNVTRDGEGRLKFTQENGEVFGKGINSTYEYYRIS